MKNQPTDCDDDHPTKLQRATVYAGLCILSAACWYALFVFIDILTQAGK